LVVKVRLAVGELARHRWVKDVESFTILPSVGDAAPLAVEAGGDGIAEGIAAAERWRWRL